MYHRPLPRSILIILLLLPLLYGSATAQERQEQADTIGAPVVFEKDTLFYIYNRLGPYSARDRADAIQSRLKEISEEMIFQSDSFVVRATTADATADIYFGAAAVMAITPEDAEALGMDPPEMAAVYATIMHERITPELKAGRIKHIIIEIGLTLLVIVALYFLIKGINRLYAIAGRWLALQTGSWINGIRLRNYEFLNAEQELKALQWVLRGLRIILVLLALYLALPVIFSIFPWTKGLADKLFDYVFSPVRKMLSALIHYIPNLFTILVIFFMVRYLVKFVRYLSVEVQRGALVIPGFYHDWAHPTYNILRFLLYAFMFIIIFPYLPGSDSPVFRGVSVFLGILFSFGSTSAISNIVAGLVITYMRPFRLGDRVKIGDITGDVLEKNMLVTRLRTIKNEDITVPNSAVLNGYTVNYSTGAEAAAGLIVNTTVTIGYDVPWKQVHALLISAATGCEGILAEPVPFVLQTSLDDFYVSYQLNAYTKEPNRQAVIYSELHKRIQDKFNEAGVEIMSPHYKALRDGNVATIPPDHLPPDYKPPGFNVHNSNSGDKDL